MINFYINLTFMLFSLILIAYNYQGVGAVYFSLFFAASGLYLWFLRERRVGNINWCHPIPVFVLGYCIVYFQLPFCYLSGLDLPFYSESVIFSPQNIPYCVLLASCGLSAFFCGEQVFFVPSIKPNSESHNLKMCNHMMHSYYIGVKNVNSVVLSLATVFFLLFLRSIGMASYFGFTYGDTSKITGSFSSHFGFVYTLLLYLSILLELSRIVYGRASTFVEYLRLWDIRVLVFILFTLVPFILSGDRGAYLQPIALVIAPYFIFCKRLKFSQAMLIVIILSFVLVLVGDTRGRKSVTWKDALIVRVESISNPSKWPTIELANSFGTFNIATKYFPETYPYNNGLNILYNVASLFPFSSYFTDIININKNNNYIFSSGLFFTNILSEGTFSFGAGSSSLADLYLDFGPYGIPVFLFLWGVVMAFISKRATNVDSAVYVFLYSYYSYYGIYVNRSSFFFGWNNIIWVLMMFYFIKRMYLDKSSRQLDLR